MIRGPGGTEPNMLIELVKSGKTFDEALADVETACGFTCEKWWIDLNRKVITETYGPSKGHPKGKG
ncbi:MAG: hypothetical protein IPO00_08845 [Betaproteobacteria bacterium]|nr:hypothetical protein [Betaproteobacteria bacterium]